MFKKLFITIGILALYKIAMLVVIPGIDLDGVPQLSSKSGFLETLNVFSGGSIDNCSLLATNITPYITATIVTQLFCSRSIGLEYFQNLRNDREMGDAKKNEWTQYFTVFFALINAIFISRTLVHTFREGLSVVYFSNTLFYFIAIPGMIAGSLFTVWVANQISKFGIGQGVSVIIFANIISNSVSSVNKIYNLFNTGALNSTQLVAIICFFFSMFFIVIFIESCNIFLPTRYAGITGKNVDQNLPLKINNAGVMPAILASSFSHFPVMLTNFLGNFFYTETLSKYASYFSNGGSFYYIISSFLIFLFTITQSEISFDPEEISKNLQESGAVIKDVRPGENTYKLLKEILFRLNFLSGIYLIIVCVFSEYFCNFINESVGEKVLQLSGTT
ncbi:MAG: preprotein translocase subunit SecY, partial [Bacteroidota bacterium]